MLAMSYGAEFAGLATAAAWSLSALAWGVAGRRVGSVPVAAIRILLAAVVLAGILWACTGAPWPKDIPDESLWLLIISGILGATAADLCLFRGLVLIGPRMGMLIMALSPIFSAAIAFVISGERPSSAIGIFGILLTMAGVAWVVSEQRGRQAWPSTPRGFRLGVMLCLLAVLFASFGYVCSRLGMSTGPRHFSAGPDLMGVDAFAGTVIRVVAAALATWMILPLLKSGSSTIKAFRDRRAIIVIVLGTVVGPVVGIWLSMIALGGQSAGIAVALIHTAPIFMIPVSYFAYGEKPTLRSLVGTCVAILGIFMMMLAK